MLHFNYYENGLRETRHLVYNDMSVLKQKTAEHLTINIIGENEPERQKVEEFIKNKYKRKYNADIKVNYPMLMSICNDDGRIIAALGFRYAKCEKLFLENYTKLPIEQILGCKRSEFVEIGNLASLDKNATVFLYAVLACYLNYKEIKYASITATEFLHNYFVTLGFKIKKICDTESSLVEHEGHNWGSYYETHPRVLVGSIDDALQALQNNLGSKFEIYRQCLLSYKQ